MSKNLPQVLLYLSWLSASFLSPSEILNYPVESYCAGIYK